jgi:hypothetical protein
MHFLVDFIRSMCTVSNDLKFKREHLTVNQHTDEIGVMVFHELGYEILNSVYHMISARV